jgi:virulence-associated protein VagC
MSTKNIVVCDRCRNVIPDGQGLHFKERPQFIDGRTLAIRVPCDVCLICLAGICNVKIMTKEDEIVLRIHKESESDRFDEERRRNKDW